MAWHLNSAAGELPGIGPTAAKDLKNLGVVSLHDLLWHFPFRYDDFSQNKPISQLRHGDTVTIQVKIKSIATRRAKTRRMQLTEAIAEDGTGAIKVVWFNQPYLEKTLRPGTVIALAGTVDHRFGPTLMNPIYEPAGAKTHTGRIVPVYSLCGSLTERRLRNAIKAALSVAHEIEEWLPAPVRGEERLPELPAAIRAVHFPENARQLAAAINRLKFDEVFLHQLMFAEVRRQRRVKQAAAMPVNEKFLQAFVHELPFALTLDQKKAAWEIIKDCTQVSPMNRLLQGDVGSGKTVVAAMALAHAINAGQKTAYLAPTELLAGQIYANLLRFLPATAKLWLFTAGQIKSGEEEVPRNQVLEAIEHKNYSCIVGTHTLIQENNKLHEVGLLVIDEQHRFGVEQRHTLLQGGESAPHLLSMTATPIPRSLALTLYGDLDLSVIKEKPQGRAPIETFLAFTKEREKMWRHARTEIQKGNRVYVICPLIEPSEAGESRSVSQTLKELRGGPLKGTRVEALHGKLKSADKEAVLRAFRDGKIDALVSTTVVEVGVDVPEATMMIVLGAEHFGLAQLHQLRGRVGRSSRQSYCYLAPETFSPTTKERLLCMVRCQDGFQLAEKDLELRGAGNVFGSAQSGFPDFKLATPSDFSLMKKARDWAGRIMEEDPEGRVYPAIKQQVEAALEQVHLE